MAARTLSEILIKNRHITQTDLDLALKKQQINGGLIGIILLNSNTITEQQLLEAMEIQSNSLEEKYDTK